MLKHAILFIFLKAYFGHQCVMQILGRNLTGLTQQDTKTNSFQLQVATASAAGITAKLDRRAVKQISKWGSASVKY